MTAGERDAALRSTAMQTQTSLAEYVHSPQPRSEE